MSAGQIASWHVAAVIAIWLIAITAIFLIRRLGRVVVMLIVALLLSFAVIVHGFFATAGLS